MGLPGRREVGNSAGGRWRGPRALDRVRGGLSEPGGAVGEAAQKLLIARAGYTRSSGAGRRGADTVLPLPVAQVFPEAVYRKRTGS